MASERIVRLRRIFGIALSCVLVLAGICLMAACVGIYRSGDEPFSREAVAAAFSPISVPVCLCLLMVAAGFVLKTVFPLPAEKTVPAKQLSVLLRRGHLRADLDACSDSLRQQITAEQKKRKNQFAVCAAVLSLCAVVFLAYALNGSHYHNSDINGSMIGVMTVMVPCGAVSFAACLVAVSARNRSIQRELDLLKQCPKASSPQAETRSNPSVKIRYAVLIAAIALAVLGFVTGGTADVLTKAVNICTECIGLG